MTRASAITSCWLIPRLPVGAYLQWGRHEKAYIALRAAEGIAHEEVAGRPSARQLVREAARLSPAHNQARRPRASPPGIGGYLVNGGTPRPLSCR